jgi:rod shape determining protein RodA
MRTYKNILRKIDWILVVLYLVLVLVGWVNIYAAVYNEEHHSIFDVTQRYGRQLMWIVLALVIAFIILLVDSQVFTSFAIPIYGVVLIALIGVLLFGVETNGARSWFRLGSFKLQPSELAKFATSLA